MYNGVWKKEKPQQNKPVLQMQTSGRRSFTGHEKYIPRNRKNATREKVENLFN